MFVDDISSKHALLARIIRSPFACGTLKAIRLPRLRDGYYLISAKDIPGKNLLPGTDMPLLAESRISYIGEPVALLVGMDEKVLEEYLPLCELDFEEGEADFLLWNQKDVLRENNIICKKEYTVLSEKPEKGVIQPEKANIQPEKANIQPEKTNIQPEKTNIQPEKGADNADETREEQIEIIGNYETGIQEHWYSEPHGALAAFDAADGVFSIKTATQDVQAVKEAVGAVLNLPRGNVKVENVEIGIHFDGKLFYPALIAALAALGAFVAKKTVKLQLSRQEDYLYSPKRCSSAVGIKSFLSKDGNLSETAINLKIFFGAYGVFTEKILNSTASAMMNIYRSSKFTLKGFALRANLPPMGPFAGFGASIASFALERHISKICDNFDEDGLDWRKSNIRRRLQKYFESICATLPDDAVTLPLDEVAKESSYKRKWAAYQLLRSKAKEDAERILPRRGIGIAFAVSLPTLAKEEGGASIASAVVEVEIDKINYEAKARGVWFCCALGGKQDKEAARKTVRRSIVASLGWTASEKISWVHGKVMPHSCAYYELPPASETPEIHIYFTEFSGIPSVAERSLTELPFSTIPAAYTQAITQAVNFHFSRIPITGLDVWRVMNLRQV